MMFQQYVDNHARDDNSQGAEDDASVVVEPNHDGSVPGVPRAAVSVIEVNSQVLVNTQNMHLFLARIL